MRLPDRSATEGDVPGGRSSLEARGSSRWSRSSLWDHGFAVLVTVSALLLQRALYPYGRSTPFILFFGAVMLSAWKGGWEGRRAGQRRTDRWSGW